MCTENYEEGACTLSTLDSNMAMFSEDLFDVFERKDDGESEKKARKAKRDSATRQKDGEEMLELKRQKLDMVAEMEVDNEVTNPGAGYDKDDRMDDTRTDAPLDG